MNPWCVLSALVLAADLPAPEAVRFSPRGEPDILLEGLLHRPARAGDIPVAGVVVCHPDPRMGGTMDNVVVTAITRAAVAGGLAVLRFNFRGVGASQGEFDGKEGEVHDVLGAFDCLSAHPGIDPERLLLAGYSFGSVMALRAFAQEARAKAYAGVSLPYSGLPHERAELAEVGKLSRPTLFLIGGEDQYGDADAIRAMLREKEILGRVQVIEGADHFHLQPDEALDAMAKAVGEYLQAEAER
jgi:alpha/beta superfamily hydrolase